MDQTRLDHALAADLVSGLEDLPLDELRKRKLDCTDLETATSYLRRLAQGRLDIVADEQRRRRTGEASIREAGLVESLAGILGAGSRQPGAGRLPTMLLPDEADTTELDRIVGPTVISELSTLDEDTLESLIDQLSAYEAGLSRLRRSLFEQIDTLQAELVRRYKTGEAKVESLLTTDVLTTGPTEAKPAPE